MAKAQRGYYELKSASGALEARLDTLRDAIPKGSTVLDIGCNDGTIGRALLESGHASEVTGVDLEDIISQPHPRFRFIQGNANSIELESLPKTDVVLLLNVLHHVVKKSRQRAKDIIDYFLDQARFVIVDMGSFTEKGNWGWKRHYLEYWSSDGEMWDDLFSSAGRRFKMLLYPTQGDGTRVLWKLYRRAETPQRYSLVQAYRRNVAAWPLKKQLVAVASEDDAPKPFGTNPGDLSRRMYFRLLRSELGDLYWAKQYVGPRAELVMEIEQFIFDQLRHKPQRFVIPVDCRPEFGMIYVFEPDLFENKPVHYQDWGKFFNEDEVSQIKSVAGMTLTLPGLPPKPLIEIADFQAIPSCEGVKFIDFTPNEWVRAKNPALIKPRPLDAITVETKPRPVVSAVAPKTAEPSRLRRIAKRLRQLAGAGNKLDRLLETSAAGHSEIVTHLRRIKKAMDRQDEQSQRLESQISKLQADIDQIRSSLADGAAHVPTDKY